jgi:membrane-associated phospholipid phosphatase
MKENKSENCNTSNLENRLITAEKIFLFYILITLVIILPGYSKTQHFQFLIFARILAMAIVFLFAYFSDNKNGFIRNFYLLAFTSWFYGETGYFNNVFFYDLDNYLVIAEKWIFSGQPSIEFSEKFNNYWFSELMYFGYFSYYLVVFGFPLLLYLKKNPNFKFMLFIILSSFYLYYLFFAIIPTVGPQFWFPAQIQHVNEGGLFTFLVRLVQEIGETPTGAFPSSHVGITWLIVFLAAKYYKTALKVLIPVAILLSISTVYIKAHYVLDVIAGLISVPILYFFSRKLLFIFTNKRYIQ